jgi:hypothetical protein
MGPFEYWAATVAVAMMMGTGSMMLVIGDPEPSSFRVGLFRRARLARRFSSVDNTFH